MKSDLTSLRVRIHARLSISQKETRRWLAPLELPARLLTVFCYPVFKEPAEPFHRFVVRAHDRLGIPNRLSRPFCKRPPIFSEMSPFHRPSGV